VVVLRDSFAKQPSPIPISYTISQITNPRSFLVAVSKTVNTKGHPFELWMLAGANLERTNLELNRLKQTIQEKASQPKEETLASQAGAKVRNTI